MSEPIEPEGTAEEHPHTHPEHYQTAYSDTPTEHFDPTHLGDPEHHPEHFETAYSENAPEEFVPQLEETKYYRIVSYLYFPVMLASLILCCWQWKYGGMEWYDKLGLAWSMGMTSGIGIVAELTVADRVGHVADRAADDPGRADIGIQTDHERTAARLGRPRLAVAIGLAPLIVGLAPQVDRSRRAALEHASGQRRDLAVRRLRQDVVIVDTKARERLQVVGIDRTRQLVERDRVVHRIGEQEQIGQHVGNPARQGDVVDALEAGADRGAIGIEPRDIVERDPLDGEIDISRGDVLGAAAAPLGVADGLVAHLVWLADAKLAAGRGYLVKLATRTVAATVGAVRHRIDVNTRERLPADALALNDVGVVELVLQAPVAFEPYARSRDLGGFIVIDRQTNATVGVGMIDEALRPGRPGSPGNDVLWQDLDVDRAARARLKEQGPAVLWFTGLSGSGKSTIANLVERGLHALGRHTYVLDGDRLRHGLNRDLGFGEADRAENVRRISEVAALFTDAGLIVLVSAISPYRADRARASEVAGEAAFLEVFVDTPVEECRRRDPKGLYRKVDAGLIRGFTGVDAPYEAPEAPDLRLRTAEATAEQLAEQVVVELRWRGLIA